MTYHDGQPEAFPYPPKPWSDGQTTYKDNGDGTRTVATYEQQNNVWHVEVIADAGLGEYYITTRDVHTVPPSAGQSFLETQFAELNEAERKGEVRAVPLQSDVNQELLYTLFNQRRKQTRARTTTDFLQNTVNEGEWEYDDSYQASELPEQGKFALFDGAGSPVNLWEAVQKIVINGTGRNLESLADMRRGAVINLFDVILNSFAQYVVQNVTFIGSPQGGQFWLDLDVRVITGRAAGSIPPGAVSEIQVIQQRPCIVNNSTTPPLVNNDGFLWYDKAERKMYVSNWSGLNSPNGHASWISTDYKDVVKTVTYYTDPASFDDQDGAIAGDGVNWYISPQAAGLTPGATIEIADEGYRTVVSVEQKNDLTMPYTAVVLDQPVNLNQADNTITHLHTPYEGSDQGQPGPDGDFLPLAGGTLIGPVNTKTDGYAFEVIRQDVKDQNGDPIDNVPLVTAFTGSNRSEFTYNKLPATYSGDGIEVANVAWVKRYVTGNPDGPDIDLGVLDDYATLDYVNDNFLKLTGGTVTGTITAQGGIKTASIDGGASNLLLKRDGSAKISIDDTGGILNGQFRLFQEGTNNDHLITKKYVDDAVATGVGGVDLSDYATIVYSDAGDGAVLDEVLKELDRFREEIGLAEYSFNYTLREDNQGGQTQDGDCLIGDTDPTANQMFILDDVQRDGTPIDHSLLVPGDEIIFEQDLGHKIVYEIVEVRDTATQVILSVNFLRYEGDNVRGFQQFVYDRLALIYKEGQLDNGGGGGGNLDDYLPLAGGSMTGDIKMSRGTHIDSLDQNGQNFRFLTFNAGLGLEYQGSTSNDNNVINRKAMVAYVDDAVTNGGPDLSLYIKRGDDAILGDMQASSLRTLNVDSGNASNLNLKCNGATKIYVGSSTTTIQGPLKLNTEGVNDDEVVTKGYVDSVASGSGYVVPEWTWVNVLWDSASPGNWGMVDRNNQSTSRFADCRGIWWTTLDRAGNRPFNDANWQDWSGYFPGPLYIQRNGESIFRVAQASGLNSYVLIDFVRDMGLYYVGWDQSDLGTAIGGYTGVTNGGAYGLLIPEFINQ